MNIDLSKRYLKRLHTPKKAFYTFSHSAHSPLFEETEKFKEIIKKDILNGLTNYADTD